MECLELRIYAISVKVNIDKFSRVMAQCTCAQTPHCLIIRYFHCVQKKRLKNNVPASPSLRTSTTSGSPLNPHMQSSPLTSELPLTSHTPTSSPSTPASSHLREGGECFQSTGVDTFHGSSSSSTIDVDTPCSGFSFEDASDMQYTLDTPGRRILGEMRSGQTPFLTTAAQLERFLAEINNTSKCKVESCNGILVLRTLELVGNGGDGTAFFFCSGRCGTRDICLPCSNMYKTSNQSELSMALQVAFLCSGANYALYERVLGSLGMHPVPKEQFYRTIKLLYDPVQKILDEQCELAKQKMKDAPSDSIGSWKKAVTVADGAWMTRGYHSQNFTFHVRDYTRGSILYYQHLCQRGGDKNELYQGTSKSCEGYAAGKVFQKMHEEGMLVVTHWQDADSTSAREVQKYFESSKIMLCGGHFSRAHFNQLKKIKQQKRFGPGEKNTYRKKFPKVEDLECTCVKQHRKNCGCINDAFISNSRSNIFMALQQAGKDPNLLKARLKMLPYHAQDIHTWEGGGHCDFHPQIVCSCGECNKKYEPACEGKAYKTTNKITCPYHVLAYEIECHNRAEQAEDLIHPELGRGHTNQLESANSALIRFRRKNWYLQRTHYHVSTNFGLLESNLTFMHSEKGIGYHWMPALLQELGLPNIDVIEAHYKGKNNEREKQRLKRKSTEYHKKNCTS